MSGRRWEDTDRPPVERVRAGPAKESESDVQRVPDLGDRSLCLVDVVECETLAELSLVIIVLVQVEKRPWEETGQ